MNKLPSGLTAHLADLHAIADHIDSMADEAADDPDLSADVATFTHALTDELRRTTDQLTEHLEKIGLLPPPPRGGNNP